MNIPVVRLRPGARGDGRPCLLVGVTWQLTGDERQTLSANWMIVQFGLNDCNYWQTDRGVPRVSARAFAANLEEIIERGVRFGAQLIILNTNHPTTRPDLDVAGARFSYEANNRRYNELIRQVAASRPQSAILNDGEDRLAFLAELVAAGRVASLGVLLLEDGLHRVRPATTRTTR